MAGSDVLRLGDRVPEIVARSTKGMVRISDFHGSWLVFFMHPADFTPVCTSEFVSFARSQEVFTDMNCKLLGLSVDSLLSHLAWIRAIHDRFDVKIDFPIIEDPTLVIARACGMISPDAEDASSVRSTLVIDPVGIVRAIMAYPVEIGRSIPEIIRTVRALRRVHDGGVLAPADWEPGCDLLREIDTGIDSVLEGADSTEWFYEPVPDVA